MYTIQINSSLLLSFNFPQHSTHHSIHTTPLSTSHHSPQHITLTTTPTLHKVHTTHFMTHHTLHNTPHSTTYTPHPSQHPSLSTTHHTILALHITPHSPHHTTHYTPQEFDAPLSELKLRGTLSGQVPERQLLSSKLEFKFNSALSNLCSDSPSWKHQLEETLLQLGQIHEL